MPTRRPLYRAPCACAASSITFNPYFLAIAFEEEKGLEDFNGVNLAIGSLNDISNKGSYIVLEGIEKPGNLGAILRTAESTGITAVIICDVKVDIYHPQVIRNSLGCSFLVKTIEAESTEVLNVLKDKGLNIFTTYMEDSVSLFECDLRSNCVIVLGTEHSGVSEIWRNQGQNINIPMQGEIDSMNVSVASSIFMYESLRQRLSSSIK